LLGTPVADSVLALLDSGAPEMLRVAGDEPRIRGEFRKVNSRKFALTEFLEVRLKPIVGSSHAQFRRALTIR
jgi:hypothetical protein